MSETTIHTIDLNFVNRAGTIGTYLVPHSGGCILIETGPCSTTQNLLSGIKKLGFESKDVSDVFLTHIHLDHAGSAGWWASQGAQIHVHENGASHLINPEKLLASARRLYGDRMDELWGDIIPVPADHVSIMHDQEVAVIGNLSILALDVPGHASHHLAYIIDDACFTGDIGGIRLNPNKYLSLPLPPPDINLEKWCQSILYIKQFQPRRIIPTHFGIYYDADWHLNAVLNALDEVQKWIEERMLSDPSLEELRRQFIEFEQTRAEKYGVDLETVKSHQIANPSFMSADGLMRYWKKYRNPD